MDELFAAAAVDTVGLAWGRLRHGELVDGGGFGRVTLDGDIAPHVDTQFRIASMTKSFTAAAVLLLRDRGRLGLDDDVRAHVPELGELRGPTTDSAPITLRRLLSMNSGMPTDDPWADRLLDADVDTMNELFARGAHFAVAPDDEFVYSNYGYAMIGRAIETVAGAPFGQFITDEILDPLGMTRTSWEVMDAGGSSVAHPHRFRNGVAIEEIVPMGHGGFASMGGLWSTVSDLAIWVAWLSDAFPARDGVDAGPLLRSSRREMCTPSRLFPASATIVPGPAGGGGPSVRTVSGGYGFGVIAVEDSTLGLMVSHSGGLPGYGSNMRWLPRRDAGVIALANTTYAPMHETTKAALDAAHDAELVSLAPVAGADSSNEQLARRLVALLNDWSDVEADEIFAFNVALDDTYADRRDAVAALISDEGPLEIAEITPRHAARTSLGLTGPTGGSWKLTVDVTPDRPRAIQGYTITRC